MRKHEHGYGERRSSQAGLKHLVGSSEDDPSRDQRQISQMLAGERLPPAKTTREIVV